MMRVPSFSDDTKTTIPENVPEQPEIFKHLEDTDHIQRDISTYSVEQREIASARYKLLDYISKNINGGWTEKNITPLLEAYNEIDVIGRPSWLTVYRWQKRYLANDCELTSLVDRHKLKGNRKARVIGDEDAYEQAVKRYLNTKRPSVAKAYDYYKNILIINNAKPNAQQIKIISYKSFNKRLKKLEPYEVAVARRGKKRADMEFRYHGGRKPVTNILERVEIDHTTLDLMLIDDELLAPLGRPYLTILIDVFSSCILGYHLGFNAPSYDSVAKAMVHAIKPKEGLKTQNPWPCYGKMQFLVVDNGAEFWSESLADACGQLDISILPNRVGHPWEKPTVERVFGQTNQKLLSDLPGKTFSNILQKEIYNPQNFAVIRFSTFIDIFEKWIVDVYHQEPNSRETRIPIKKWQEGFEALGPIEIEQSDIKRLTVTFGRITHRTLNSKGIKYEDIRYHSTALSDYWKKYPQTKASRRKKIKVNPDDLSSIHVYLEELDCYIKVHAADQTGYTKNLSLHTHMLHKRYLREYTRKEKNELNLATAKLEIDQLVKEDQDLFKSSMGNKTSLKSPKKQAAYRQVSNVGARTIKSPSIEPKPVKAKPETLLERWSEILDDLDD